MYQVVVLNRQGEVVRKDYKIFAMEYKADNRRKQVQYLLDKRYPDLGQYAQVRETHDEDTETEFAVYNHIGQLMAIFGDEVQAIKLANTADDWTWYPVPKEKR